MKIVHFALRVSRLSTALHIGSRYKSTDGVLTPVTARSKGHRCQSHWTRSRVLPIFGLDDKVLPMLEKEGLQIVINRDF